jgi:hypothetical protein
LGKIEKEKNMKKILEIGVGGGATSCYGSCV